MKKSAKNTVKSAAKKAAVRKVGDRYAVSMRVDGRYTVYVDAKDAEDAFDKANEAFMDVSSEDLGKGLEIADCYPINCLNERTDVLTDSNY